ncbi:MAG: polyamine aminopropyltransferase [Ghiorsea sp.]|nr:polyamine aminopropyltransferase [Ghiorsea sp.]
MSEQAIDTLPQSPLARKHSLTIIYAAFIAGLCSIIYELLIATTVSYFLGDSVKYFSLTIGMYMAAMGMGSFVSKYIERDLLRKFIIAELWLGVLGGMSIPVLYFAFTLGNAFVPCYIFFTLSIGFLIGLEIPFLTRLMEEYKQLQFNIANILSVDYLGALIATVSFPFILLPFFGVYQSSLLFGLVNMSIGVVMLWMFSDVLQQGVAKLKMMTTMLSGILVLMMVCSASLLSFWDSRLYDDRIVFSEQTRYQRIVLTKHRDDIRLFLNGNLQFSSLDEYRYHESLVHVPLSLHAKPVRRVLLLGAGDGLAVRELLKYPFIEEIVLVDLDKEIIKLAKENPYVSDLNQHSLSSSKVKVVISDAFSYLNQNEKLFDFIISDLPDPNNQELARLYSKQFYRLLRHHLSEDGLFVTQATSPYFAPKAFWSIQKTIAAAGFDYTYPYHALIPSFGDWGFVLAGSQTLDLAHPVLQVDTTYLQQHHVPSLFVFSKDMAAHDEAVNTLDRPVLLEYYLQGWNSYAR